MADVVDGHVTDYDDNDDDDDVEPQEVPVHAAAREARTLSLPALVELASS